MYSRNETKKSTESSSIEGLKSALETADAILIGAGAGLSASAGLTYSGERFERYFSDFYQKYGIGNILHHLLKSGAVKDDAAVAIVNFVGHNLNVGIALNEILNELALVGNAVALAGAVIRIRQTDVGSCFVP